MLSRTWEHMFHSLSLSSLRNFIPQNFFEVSKFSEAKGIILIIITFITTLTHTNYTMSFSREAKIAQDLKL